MSVLLTVLLYCSCENKKEEPPFVGTWLTTNTQEGFEMKDSLTLTENTFTDIISISVNNNWLEYMGIEGTHQATGNQLVLNADSVAMAKINIFTGEIYNGLEWYKRGSEEFNQYISKFGMATMKGEYLIDGDTLTVKMDMDGDGFYSAYGEITDYLRK
jgi:hypothetical protein